MTRIYSTKWKASKESAKQRKYQLNAPLHKRAKLTSSNLSKDLRKKHGIRSIGLRLGDKVKIMRGQFKGTTGKVEKVIRKDYKAIISGINITKKDGSTTQYPIGASNLQIIELTLDDKKRIKKQSKQGEQKNG
ncbi:50S ribosomal protein L24 [Candidatus Woesearchaeota archaeon]|nr:50S ribosomal protein L24 [Candidatus Woesearchaeota archaeon]